MTFRTCWWRCRSQQIRSDDQQYLRSAALVIDSLDYPTLLSKVYAIIKSASHSFPPRLFLSLSFNNLSFNSNSLELEVPLYTSVTNHTTSHTFSFSSSLVSLRYGLRELLLLPLDSVDADRRCLSLSKLSLSFLSGEDDSLRVIKVFAER